MANIHLVNTVLNQKGNPAWYEDTFANRPTAGYSGRMFVAIDTFSFYRDNGTSWDLIGGTGGGAVTGTGTATQVAYWNSASGITGSANLFWDNTNARLGISTNVPGAALDVHSVNTVVTQIENTTLNDTLLAFRTSGTAYWRIGNLYNAGANSFQIFDVTGATARVTITNTGVTTINGAVTATSLAITGGTAAQFLKANGTVDSNTYVTSASLASYLPLTGGTLTGGLTGTTANFTGLTLNGAGSGNFTLNTTNATASTSVTTGSIVTAGGLGVTGAIWAGSFVRNGGASSQFLKADGSVDGTAYLSTTTAGTTYVPYTAATGAVNLGSNSLTSGALSATTGTFTGQVVVPSGSGNVGMKINYSANTSSRSWWLYSDYAAFGDFQILQSTTQTGTTYTPILAFSPTGSATFSNTVQATTFFAQSDSAATSPNQIQVQGNTSTLKQLLIGYNTTGNGYGSIQAIFQGTSVTPLVFQPSGGNVLIGSTTDSGQAILQVAGVTNTFGLSTTGEVVSATATLTKQYYHVFTGAAGQTLTMPTPASNNIQYCIINNTANTVTIAAAATTNIITLSNTSVASIVLAANARAIFIADGNNKYYQIV